MLRVEAGLSSMMSKYDKNFKVKQISMRVDTSSDSDAEKGGFLQQVSAAFGFKKGKNGREDDYVDPALHRKNGKVITSPRADKIDMARRMDEERKRLLAEASEAAGPGRN